MTDTGAPDASLDLVNTVRAARRFYLDGVSKSDIGEELGLSRYKVARLLDSARQRGIVRIDIDVPADIDFEMSTDLASAFSLRHALVLAAQIDGRDVSREQLGKAAALTIAGWIGADDVVGWSWGRTLDATVESLPALPPCASVQIVGSVGSAEISEQSIDLVRRVAHRSNGPVFPLHVPLVFDTPEAADAVRHDRSQRRTMAMFGRLTKAVIGIGSWKPVGSALRDSLSPALRARARQLPIVADLCTSVFAADGSEIRFDDLRSRTVGITTEQLRKVPNVLAVAGGRGKITAIRATLLSGLLHGLVTDQVVAQALLKSRRR